MNPRRLLKKLATALITVLFFAVIVDVAHAYNVSQAVKKANKEQRSDCRGNPIFRCDNPAFLPPVCIGTGHNQPGVAQYICGGAFTRVNRITLEKKYCLTTYQLTPWGRVLNFWTYKCFWALALLPSIKTNR